MLGEDDNVKDSRKKSFRSNKRSKKEICIRPNFSKQFVKRFFEAKSRNFLKAVKKVAANKREEDKLKNKFQLKT